jgi:hypothetical protein
MNRRLLLVVLLVVSTAAFVVGVSVERSSGDSHDEPAATAASREAAESGEEHADEGAEGEASQSAVEADSEGAGEAGQDEDESVLGVDLEATPFVVLAAAASLGLAVAVWLRPEWRPLLGLVAAVMVAFAALDVREVVHQVDEHNGGLAVLAGVVAALHLAAAAIALSMGRSRALAPRDSLA